MNPFQPIDPALAQGKTEALLGGLVANVALKVFTNCFSSVTRPHVDFPVLKPRALAQAA